VRPALLICSCTANVARRRFLSNTKVTEPSDFRLTRSFPSLALPTVMPDESRRNGDCALPQGGHAASANEETTVSETPSSGDAEEMPRPKGRRTSVIAMHKQGWLCVAPFPLPMCSAVCAVLWRATSASLLCPHTLHPLQLQARSFFQELETSVLCAAAW
jgi:hypothetical protein